MEVKTVADMHKRRKLRNPLANDPLLSKGGVHEKSPKAKRAKQKRELRKQVMNRDDSSPFSFMACSTLLALTS